MILLAVIACFFFSGFAALLYQVAWLRQFSLVFGTSEIAVAIVLAAYMAGLTVGAIVIAKIIHKIKKPVFAYGLLEGGIAISALLVPILIFISRGLYSFFLGDQIEPPDSSGLGQSIFYLIASFIIILIPTALMGATLPLLSRYAITTNNEIGPRVSLLYGINTLGAVFGAIVAGFILLPKIGLNGTIWSGVFVNLAIFLIAIILDKNLKNISTEKSENNIYILNGFFKTIFSLISEKTNSLSQKTASIFNRQKAWILPLMLFSGLNSFIYEVLWTRMLSHVIGGSIYAFSTMLATFLLGIAIGGGLAGKITRDRDLSINLFCISQIFICILSIFIYYSLGPLMPNNINTFELSVYAISVMLPATIFIGATFPLAVHILVENNKVVGSGTALVYSWNTIGAIIGSIYAGFFLIPEFGFEGAIKFAVLINILIALFGITFISKLSKIFSVAILLAALSILFLYNPLRPESVIMRTGFVLNYLNQPREFFYEVGKSSTVMVLAEDGYYFIRTNGLPEASIASKGSPPVQDPEKWLTALPVTARPDIKDMMVIGFGGGVALEGIPPSVQNIDVIEIEEEVINANKTLKGMRNTDPLEDNRINIIINDARNAMKLTRKKYDAIVSQPSHPWTAGSSHLFTREFIKESKAHLENDGIFVQWMNSEFITESLLKTLTATLLSEFKYLKLYHPASQVLMFLASDEAIDPEINIQATRQPLLSNSMHYSKIGINSSEDLIAAMAIDQNGLEIFAQNAKISTDNNNLMATQSRPFADGILLPELLKLFEPYDPLLNKDSWIYKELGGEIDYGYLAKRLINMSQYERASKIAMTIPSLSKQLEIYAHLLLTQGRLEESTNAFISSLEADNDNIQSRYNIASHYLGVLNKESIPEEVDIITSRLSGSAAAVIEGWDLASASNWSELIKLENELANTKVTDAWYPDAARLRAEWRINVSVDEKKYAYDALRLIDRAIILQPDQNLFLMRAMSSLILEDFDTFIESARYILNQLESSIDYAIYQDYKIPLFEFQQMQYNLSSINDKMNQDISIDDQEKINLLRNNLSNLNQKFIEYLEINQ
ncbi:MAG: hypothetical protein CBC38_07070 [Gammaproteobacteria bacterium TMED78]|nr:MAG: hypothetical protein CBC38_07070 [Gammaproteobacteria bacterium TMED78]|tara:strand:- start:14217 stop:17420 length:3204 start_codon:yes stop_codon:yes gene_type:complete